MIKSARHAGIYTTRDSGTYLTSVGMKAPPPDSDPIDVRMAELQGQIPTPMESESPLHATIRGLVDELAKDAPTWDAARRKIWETAFSGVLDYVYPKTKRLPENDIDKLFE